MDQASHGASRRAGPRVTSHLGKSTETTITTPATISMSSGSAITAMRCVNSPATSLPHIVVPGERHQATRGRALSANKTRGGPGVGPDRREGSAKKRVSFFFGCVHYICMHVYVMCVFFGFCCQHIFRQNLLVFHVMKIPAFANMVQRRRVGKRCLLQKAHTVCCAARSFYPQQLRRLLGLFSVFIAPFPI